MIPKEGNAIASYGIGPVSSKADGRSRSRGNDDSAVHFCYIVGLLPAPAHRRSPTRRQSYPPQKTSALVVDPCHGSVFF